MKKVLLLTPGPTPVPERVLLAMAKPMIHHRTNEFQGILKEVEENLKYVFCTKNDVIILAGSGTGAMESAVANLLSPGDTAIVVRAGKFGERWSEICEAYGIKPVNIDKEWGSAVTPSEIEAALKSNPNTKVVFITACETSTGAETDVKAIAGVVSKTNSVLVVDAISSLGAVELKMDEWGVDVVISGSQKGLMTPPGLAFIAMSNKAWALAESSKCPKYYYNLKKAKKSIEKTDTPWTPAVSLIIGLNEALKMIKEEGLENVIARHSRLANAARNAMKGLGLELFSQSPANTVTPVKVPAGVDGEKLVKDIRSKYGISIAGGQDEMKGKIFRIACLGYVSEFDLFSGISAIERELVNQGYKIELGKGVKAAQEALLKK
jgi:aspartate aminotransferase-like enzyme